MAAFRLRQRFPVKRRLTEAEIQRGLQSVIRDGMASQALASLTGSTFLVALALHLGASNTLIGVLAAIPHLSQLIQLPAIHLVRRVRNRRLVTVVASSLGRLSWVFVAAAPFVLGDAGTLTVLTLGLLAASLLAGIANCGWNSWLHELVPKSELGRFFGRRFSLATATGIVVSMSAAFFLDHLAPTLLPDLRYGYSLIFLLGFCCGAFGVYFVAKIPEAEMHTSEGSLRQLIAQPFRDPNFNNLLRFLAAWNVAFYLATPFFSVYMLKRLEMDLSWVVGLVVLGRLINILFLRLWGSFSDRISNTSVLAVSGPLCLLCILGWTFTTLPDPHAFTLPLLVTLHVLMGIAMAGITLATGNIGLKLAPDGKGTNYLAATNFVTALTAGIAPMVSGPLVDLFVRYRLAWRLEWTAPTGTRSFDLLNLQQWDFLFVLSFVVGLYALHRLSFIRETGTVGERVVLAELFYAFGREMRDFSTVATFRRFNTMPGASTLRHRADDDEAPDPTPPDESPPSNPPKT